MSPHLAPLVRLAFVVALALGWLFVFRRLSWLPYVWGLSVRAIAMRPAKEGEVVFVGSSTITFWSSLPRDMAPLPAVNRGFGGSMIAHTTHYLARLLPKRPAAVVLSAGSNDLAWGKSVDRVVRDLEALATALHVLHPGVPLYFLSINRAPSRRFYWRRFDEVNRRAQVLAERDPLVRYVDASSAIYDERGIARSGIFGLDRLHMTDAGYAAWTSVIKPRLLADLGALSP